MSETTEAAEVFDGFKTQVINVTVGDAREIPRLESRLNEFGFMVSKHIMYSWLRDKSRKSISSVVYVVAIPKENYRAFNIMLSQLQNNTNLQINI